jgi:hypothetical protein
VKGRKLPAQGTQRPSDLDFRARLLIRRFGVRVPGAHQSAGRSSTSGSVAGTGWSLSRSSPRPGRRSSRPADSRFVASDMRPQTLTRESAGRWTHPQVRATPASRLQTATGTPYPASVMRVLSSHMAIHKCRERRDIPRFGPRENTRDNASLRVRHRARVIRGRGSCWAAPPPRRET